MKRHLECQHCQLLAGDCCVYSGMCRPCLLHLQGPHAAVGGVRAPGGADAERILFIDGAMGTMIQRYKLGEQDYRGERYGSTATS